MSGCALGPVLGFLLHLTGLGRWPISRNSLPIATEGAQHLVEMWDSIAARSAAWPPIQIRFLLYLYLRQCNGETGTMASRSAISH
jgi:hypothetical protein